MPLNVASQEAQVLVIERVTDISSVSEQIADKILPDQVSREQVSSDKIGIGDFVSPVSNSDPLNKGEVIQIDSKDVDRIIKRRLAASCKWHCISSYDPKIYLLRSLGGGL